MGIQHGPPGGADFEDLEMGLEGQHVLVVEDIIDTGGPQVFVEQLQTRRRLVLRSVLCWINRAGAK